MNVEHYFVFQGFYCEAENITSPTGLCHAGYYCILGAITPTPEPADNTGGPCWQGTFCPNGTTWPFNCPKGTFGHMDKLTAEDDCTDCWTGYYCSETGLTAPNGTCEAGKHLNIFITAPNGTCKVQSRYLKGRFLENN